MPAFFPAGDVSAGNGTSADSMNAVGFISMFVCVYELKVALGFAHASPLIFNSVCQCCCIPASIVR